MWYSFSASTEASAPVVLSLEKYSREKSSVMYCTLYVVSVVAYQISFSARIDADLTNWIFTHVGLSAHAHNNYCAEVEVHGWLLSVQ